MHSSVQRRSAAANRGKGIPKGHLARRHRSPWMRVGPGDIWSSYAWPNLLWFRRKRLASAQARHNYARLAGDQVQTLLGRWPEKISERGER